MNDFAIGDRVMSLVDAPASSESIMAGDVGTICDINVWGDGWVGVCWDNPVEGGHDCDGHCEQDHGWRVPAGALDFETEDEAPPFQFDETEFNKLFL